MSETKYIELTEDLKGAINLARHLAHYHVEQGGVRFEGANDVIRIAMQKAVTKEQIAVTKEQIAVTKDQPDPEVIAVKTGSIKG